MLACLAICVLSMFLSSFSTKVWPALLCESFAVGSPWHVFEVWHLILLQGIVYGASGGLLYSPYIIWVGFLSTMLVNVIIDSLGFAVARMVFRSMFASFIALIHRIKFHEKRRSVAGSLIFAGMGLGGAIFPPIMNYLLERTGFRWTLRVWSAMLLLFGGVSIVGIKPRLPVAPASYSGPLPPVDLTFLKSPLFLSMVWIT